MSQGKLIAEYFMFCKIQQLISSNKNNSYKIITNGFTICAYTLANLKGFI